LAHFIGFLTGQRGNIISRLGSKNSGLTVEANGWNFGIQARIKFNVDTGKDEILITLTDGSKQQGKTKFLGRYTKESLECA
jgi:hypothetical protein